MSESAEERAMHAQLKQPLEVDIHGGELRISIGLDTLAFALHASPQWPTEFKIVDAATFGREFLLRLTKEKEDGTTPVHELLDRVGIDALEQGAEGVEESSAAIRGCGA